MSNKIVVASSLYKKKKMKQIVVHRTVYEKVNGKLQPIKKSFTQHVPL